MRGFTLVFADGTLVMCFLMTLLVIIDILEKSKGILAIFEISQSESSLLLNLILELLR